MNDTFATRQKEEDGDRSETKRKKKNRKTEKEKFVMCLYSKTIVSISGLMRCARQFPRLRIIEFAKYVLRFLDSSTSTRRAPHTTPANHLVDAFFLSCCVSRF